MRHSYKLCFTFFFFVSWFFPAAFALADGPVVSAFIASPSSINHGFQTNLSWTIPGGGYGQKLYFICPAGIGIKNSSGVTFPCDTRQVVGEIRENGSASFTLTNVSGSTRSVSVRVIPLDANGGEYDAGGMSTVISVATVSEPITDFTISTSTVVSGSSFTLSWTAHDITGVNLQFDCVSGLHVVSSSPSVSEDLPCGAPAYSTDLAVSGSAVVSVRNDYNSSATLPIHLFPAISAGSYDAIHGKDLSVQITQPAAAPTPTISSFTSSSTQVVSGGQLLFFWSSENTTGVNLQFQCNDYVSFKGIQTGEASSTPLVCGVPAFALALPSTGSTLITFTNQTGTQRYVPVTLLPKKADGTYDGTRSSGIGITIVPPGTSATPPPPAPVPMPAPGSSTTSLPVSGSIKALRTGLFVTPLAKGSRGAAVTALQKFLALDPSIYPEGIVSGYFGALSELAVKKFQERYGLAKKGDAGYGFVGPKTRLKMNTMQYF